MHNTGFDSHRPPGYAGKSDRLLSQLAQELKRLLIRAEDSLAFDTLCLPSHDVEDLAGVLVEFAEDVHNGVGIWNSLEQYNLEFFGTRLPFILGTNENTEHRPINEHRLQHLLWVLYSELRPGLVLSPTHSDLKQVADIVSVFLEERFAGIPRGSAVKAFLSQPNTFGWDVKRKLVWLGTHSYLFRNSFRNYVEEHGKKPGISVTDDFVCQQTTAWSGLGVIDILAATLNISLEQRVILRSWYARHDALYQVLSIKGPLMQVLNAISGKQYIVQMGEGANPFRVGQAVWGSLVPWNEEWYWSGQQATYDSLAEGELQKLKTSFLRESPLIAYRYCHQLAEKATDILNLLCHEFLDYHGDDLVVYPDGLSMASDIQKEMRLQWECQPAEVVSNVMAKYKMAASRPSLSVSDGLLKNEKGVGVYFDPDEGREMIAGFNDIMSGLKKRGDNLNEDEENGILGFVRSDQISPRFVRRVVQDYGHESIASAFMIRGSHEDYELDYLLRRYKGAYYRKRYPRITLI